jgi:hypothetical protein
VVSETRNTQCGDTVVGCRTESLRMGTRGNTKKGKT